MTSIFRGEDAFDTGDWITIQSVADVSVSASRDQDIVFGTDVKLVKVEYHLVAADDNWKLQFRAGNGSIDTGSNYSWSREYVQFATTPTYGATGAASADDKWNITGATGNVNDEGCAGTIYLQVGSGRLWGHWDGSSVNTSDVGFRQTGAGIYYGNTADRFRLFHTGATDGWNAGWYRVTGYIPRDYP